VRAKPCATPRQRPLTPFGCVCSLLKNKLGEKGANSIVEVAKNKPHLITLCGLNPDQTSADFSKQGLGMGDAILLAFDLKKNSVLVDLK
jgi:hypothetical protein